MFYCCLLIQSLSDDLRSLIWDKMIETSSEKDYNYHSSVMLRFDIRNFKLVSHNFIAIHRTVLSRNVSQFNQLQMRQHYLYVKSSSLVCTRDCIELWNWNIVPTEWMLGISILSNRSIIFQFKYNNIAQTYIG